MPQHQARLWRRQHAAAKQTLCDSSSDQGSSMSSEVITWALKIPSSGKGRFKGNDQRLQRTNLKVEFTEQQCLLPT